MVELMTGVSTAIDIARKLKQASDAIKDSESKLLIAELINQLAELKITCSELLTENSELKNALNEIKKQKMANVVLVGDIYMSENDGPYCTSCWDSKNKKIRLKEQITDLINITGHRYICPVCSTMHKGENG